MGDFSMTRYYKQYIEAVNKAERLEKKLEGLKSSMLYVDDKDRPAVAEAIDQTTEALQAAEQEVQRMWYKAYTGKEPEEVSRSGIVVFRDRFGKEV